MRQCPCDACRRERDSRGDRRHAMRGYEVRVLDQHEDVDGREEFRPVG